jgi:hypothetical protein
VHDGRELPVGEVVQQRRVRCVQQQHALRPELRELQRDR